jgi:biotin carboxyl carrier protein
MAKPKRTREKEDKNNSYKILNIDSVLYKTTFTNKFLNRKPYEIRDPKKVLAFIPGKIKKVMVKKGSKVDQGDQLLVLEAMKMNNVIMSPIKGMIKEVHVSQGAAVAKNQLLLEFK